MSAEYELARGPWRLALDEEGRLASLFDGEREWAQTPLAPAVAITDSRSRWVSGRPINVASSDEGLEFTFRTTAPVAAEITLTYKLLPLSDGGVAVERNVRIRSEQLHAPLEIVVPHGCDGSREGREDLVPRIDGVAFRRSDESWFQGAWYYEVAGPTPRGMAGDLGVPMIDAFWPSLGWGIAYCADPAFSVRLGYPGEYFSPGISWGLDGQAGKPLDHSHRIYCCIHRDGLEGATRAFYESALADVPPGPEWLHDIALVSIDYMSQFGEGWFRDIDALAASLNGAERSHVLVCLHGWYDYVGHYAFDKESGRLEQEWLALANADAFRGSQVFPNIGPVPMTPDEVRRRLAYARERGFRVALYFAAGTIADDLAGGFFTPEAGVGLGLWQGPDTKGTTYIMTPAHPQVFDWFLSYTDALLHEFGDFADAFSWDYTLFPQAEHDAWSDVPGYGPEAMMRLVKRIAAKCHAHRLDLGFIASDLISGWRNVRVPYSIMADGAWQDSFCEPDFWGYMIWPNLRNVAWSHNFMPRSHFGYARFGVDHFQAAVPMGFGFVENEGFADLPPKFLDEFLTLFRERAQRRTTLRPFTEEEMARLRLAWKGPDW